MKKSELVEFIESNICYDTYSDGTCPYCGSLLEEKEIFLGEVIELVYKILQKLQYNLALEGLRKDIQNILLTINIKGDKHEDAILIAKTLYEYIPVYFDDESIF